MTQTTTEEPLPAAVERDFDHVPPSALSAIEAASLNQAILMAHRYPRRIGQVKERMFELATLDVETAESCNYSLKRKNKRTGETKEITGESIRMAELAASAYGNIDAGSRVVEVLDGFVSCQGVASDLENGFRTTVNVYQRILIPGPDGIALAAAAGCSKALRNAILTVVPRAIVRPIAKAAATVAAGDSKTMEARRRDKIRAFRELGVPVERLFEWLRVKSADEIGIDAYKQMVALLTALREGETTVAEEFPAAPKKPEFKQEEPPAKPEVAAKEIAHLKETVRSTPPPPAARGPGRPKKVQAPEPAQEEFLAPDMPLEEPPLFIQVGRKLGEEPGRLKRFWETIVFWDLASADTKRLEEISEENLRSLLDNWESVETALK